MSTPLEYSQLSLRTKNVTAIRYILQQSLWVNFQQRFRQNDCLPVTDRPRCNAPVGGTGSSKARKTDNDYHTACNDYHSARNDYNHSARNDYNHSARNDYNHSARNDYNHTARNDYNHTARYNNT
jgi:hypothetical protein